MVDQSRSYSLVGRLRKTLWAMALLPILAGVAFFLLHSSRTLQASAANELNTTLSLQRQFIENWVGKRSSDIGFLAADPRVLQLSTPALTDMLRAMLEYADGFNDIVYVDERGVTRADPKFTPGEDVSDREYFRAALQGRSFISEVLTSRVSGRKVIFVSCPVYDTSRNFRGLVFGTIALERLSTLMQTVQASTAAQTFLMRADGEIIAPLERKLGLKAGDRLYDSAVARAELAGVYRSASGRRVVGAYQWILDERWLLAAERPEADILATHAAVLGVPLAGALLVFLLFGPALMRTVRSLRRPVQVLEDHAREIEAGNYDADCQPLTGTDAPSELVRLNQAYCLMVERVRKAMIELLRASLTDPLTGAGNRKRLQEEGPRLLEGSLRAGLGVSLLMLDIDHFKRVNDSRGHPAGDAVLKTFAALLASLVRKSDLFVRYGGEEFVVLAPNTPLEAALILAERIRVAAEKLEVEWEQTPIRFTVSVGVATLGPGYRPEEKGDGPLLPALAQRADEALYRAKAGGRNRVELAG